MPIGGLASNPARWRVFADVVAVALGVNVWVSVVVLPGIFVGVWTSAAAVVLSSLPLIVLAIGLWRRSESVLLLGFPSALLIPAAIYPSIVAGHVYGPIRFAVVSIGLVAYLFGASFLSSFREPPPPERTRPLSSAARPVPHRWRRRFRIYAYLTVLSIVFPLTLIYTVNFDDTNRAFMRELFPGRQRALMTLLNLAAIGVWLVVYVWCFLGTLRPHRTGDRDLVVQLARLRASAQRGRPRLAFYVGVVAALVFMFMLLLLRYS